MSHRKVYSQGSIPFSWEASPGVRKPTAATTNDNSDDPTPNQSPCRAAFQKLRDDSVLSSSSRIHDVTTVTKKFLVPPPPCKPGLPKRSVSGKALTRQPLDDPFLLAFRECTRKSAGKTEQPTAAGRSKKNEECNSKFGFRSKSKSVFSCKSSCNIREDNFVRLSNLPPLPKDRRSSEVIW